MVQELQEQLILTVPELLIVVITWQLQLAPSQVPVEAANKTPFRYVLSRSIFPARLSDL